MYHFIVVITVINIIIISVLKNGLNVLQSVVRIMVRVFPTTLRAITPASVLKATQAVHVIHVKDIYIFTLVLLYSDVSCHLHSSFVVQHYYVYIVSYSYTCQHDMPFLFIIFTVIISIIFIIIIIHSLIHSSLFFLVGKGFTLENGLNS